MALLDYDPTQKQQFDGLVRSVYELRSLLQESIVEAQNARARSAELRAMTREIMASSAARREGETELEPSLTAAAHWRG